MIALEHLADGTISDRNFQALARLVPDTGGRSVAMRFGNVTLTWSASTASGNQTPAHGLPAGLTPINVQLTPRSIPFAAGVTVTAKCTARGTSTITINAEASSSVTGSVVVDWMAVG